MVQESLTFDALVVGGGIAGLQAALDLGDQDFKVAIVEKDASIGGKSVPDSGLLQLHYHSQNGCRSAP
jgi:heterodisulfide reductase subunit A